MLHATAKPKTDKRVGTKVINMKNIFLLILLLIIASGIYSQNDSLQNLQTQLTDVKSKLGKTDSSVQKINDTLHHAINNQLIVDASALDSAKKYPLDVLYKNYLLAKSHKEGISWFFAILALIILVVLWIGAIYYSLYDALCKDPSYDKNGNLRNPKDSPYSYARVQLLWWTLIILTCYVFFFGVTGVLMPLNVTAVLLLGFGAIVYGTGKIIDSRQVTENKGNRTQDNVDSDTEPDFIRDILSDDNGISIHRFQAVIFNLVFGIGFIGFFINSLMLLKYPFPDFTDWQFSLLGISSATYLGLKASENKSGANNTQPADSGEVPAPKAIAKF